MVKKQQVPFVNKTKGTLSKSAFLSVHAMKRELTCLMSAIHDRSFGAFPQR